MIERTLVLIKPDGVLRGIVGRIITKFEDSGLKIVAMKMVWPDEKTAEKHYPLDEEWAKNTFEKTKKAAEEKSESFNFKGPMELGIFVQEGLKKFITECPIVAIVLEGPFAIEIVRKIVGPTEPRQAPPGTIRGDFASIEAYRTANTLGRAVRNLVHASDSQKSSEKEIKTWFSEKEIHSYKKEQDRYLEGL